MYSVSFEFGLKFGILSIKFASINKRRSIHVNYCKNER